MKVIIAGSRTINDYYELIEAIKGCGFRITQVISGGCRGADTLGERYAREHRIPISHMLPDWNKHGRSAGPRRNSEMATQADALIALWDGESRGTKDMIEKAHERGIPVYVRLVRRANSEPHKGEVH